MLLVRNDVAEPIMHLLKRGASESAVEVLSAKLHILVARSTSFMYHCFDLSSLCGILSLTGWEVAEEALRRGVDFISDFVLRNGDAIYIGRGQQQLLAYGALIYSLSYAAARWGEERYLAATERAFRHVISHRRADGTLPLIVRHGEQGWPDESGRAASPEHPGWYRYNNFYDYEPAIGLFLARAAEALRERPQLSAAALEGPEGLTVYGHEMAIWRDDLWEAVLSVPGGYWANALPMPYICVQGTSVTPCYGGDRIPPSLYSAEMIPLPQAITRSGRRICLADELHYRLHGDGERVVLRSKDEVRVQPADRKPEGDSGESVTVDLSRLRLEIDPLREWHQMYDENARIMRDHYWREDMDGVDWAGVVTRYRPLVAGLRTHDDLVDLLWEVGAELNTSHAYVMPPEPLGDASRRLGLLGADLAPADGGWRIERILPGETTEPEARSPLRAAGVDAREGDLVVAVDGQPVDPAFGPATRLVGAAGKPVGLTLRRDGTDRRVVVVPLEDEEVLRYQDWVRSRRDYVREHSGGRVGYLHVPDMTSTGWAQLHRDLSRATRAEGLIADVRYNRGGHTSQMVLSRLLGRVVGWGLGRHYGSAYPYPDQAPRGPVVLVANENSGSDGDIVNAGAQAFGIGPVIGVRTWGGVVGIDGRFDLVDGTGITQPRYAFWLEGKGFGVENHGVDPDIEVVHSPGDFFGAADPQLDRAIAEVLARLEQTPSAQPPDWPEPRVR